MAEIVISELMEQAAVDELAAGFDVLYDPALFERPAELCAALAPARALIVRNRTEVRDVLLAAGPRLEAAGRLAVGLDNIDVEACAARTAGPRSRRWTRPTPSSTAAWRAA